MENAALKISRRFVLRNFFRVLKIEGYGQTLCESNASSTAREIRSSTSARREFLSIEIFQKKAYSFEVGYRK